MSSKDNNGRKRKEPFDEQLLVRWFFLVVYDCLAIVASGWLSLLIRFNLQYDAIDLQYIQMMW